MDQVIDRESAGLWAELEQVVAEECLRMRAFLEAHDPKTFQPDWDNAFGRFAIVDSTQRLLRGERGIAP